MRVTETLKTATILLFAGMITIGVNGCKKKAGCTDPTAVNYDATAKVDDGSCISQADQAYADADGIMGGKLYDKFWATETGWTAPTGINAADISDYGDFYRCKQCHGWDQMGNEGAYNNRAPQVGRPSVGPSLFEPIVNDPKEEFFDHIYNTTGRAVDPSLTQDGTNGMGNVMPAFGNILTEAEAWDIIKFLLEERYDVTQLYDFSTTGTYPTGTHTFSNIGLDGSATAGDAFFTANCATCHGADGKGILIVDDGDTLTVGFFGRNKPYELQHKIKFGNLGSAMVGVPTATVSDVKDLFKALQDQTKYPD